MKFLELIVVRRLTADLEPLMAGGQHTYSRQRSTELLLADLDGSIQDSVQQDKTAYLAGLDVEGAFDNANLMCLVDALVAHRVSAVLWIHWKLANCSQI